MPSIRPKPRQSPVRWNGVGKPLDWSDEDGDSWGIWLSRNVGSFNWEKRRNTPTASSLLSPGPLTGVVWNEPGPTQCLLVILIFLRHKWVKTWCVVKAKRWDRVDYNSLPLQLIQIQMFFFSPEYLWKLDPNSSPKRSKRKLKICSNLSKIMIEKFNGAKMQTIAPQR